MPQGNPRHKKFVVRATPEEFAMLDKIVEFMRDGWAEHAERHGMPTDKAFTRADAFRFALGCASLTVDNAGDDPDAK